MGGVHVDGWDESVIIALSQIQGVVSQVADVKFIAILVETEECLYFAAIFVVVLVGVLFYLLLVLLLKLRIWLGLV